MAALRKNGAAPLAAVAGPAWRGFGLWLVVAGPLTLALTVLYFATFTPTIEGVQHGVAGLTERILVLELQACYVALGWLAFSRSRGDSPLAKPLRHSPHTSPTTTPHP